MESSPNQSRRVLIIGSEGRLGGSLCRHLCRDHHVIPLNRRHMDLRSRRSIQRALEAHHYDHAILAAAMTGVDDCEREARLARRVNGEAPGWIADQCKRQGAHLTYMSSDFVFGGQEQEPRHEDDETNPINAYGASKLLGEHNVLAADSRNLVVRVSWLFGGGKPSFPEWIVGRALAEGEICLAEDKVASPTYVFDLVCWLELLILSKNVRPAEGIFHLCNGGACSWADWGRACLERAVAHGLLHQIYPVTQIPLHLAPGLQARRPANSVLHTGKFQRVSRVTPQTWEKAVDDFFVNFPFEQSVS